jgi:transposase
VASKRTYDLNQKRVILAFEDEAGFGRILDTASCWAPPKQRPCVPNERHREFRTVYGVVIPETGEFYFYVYDKNNSEVYSDFLSKVSDRFPDYYIVICCDQAGWHTTKKLNVPSNICLFFIPSHTPEMNPIEQVWKEIRKRGFKNIMFASLDELFIKFWYVVYSLDKSVIISITARDWVTQLF